MNNSPETLPADSPGAGTALSEQKEKALPLTQVLLDEEARISDLIENKETKPDERLAPDVGTISDSEAVPDELLMFRRKRSDPEFQRFAFACSGGGIRSACINLGVAQGLTEKKLLRKFHYLSTVSGGGYFGCWLSTWIRAAKGSQPVGKASMIEEAMATPENGVEAPEISNLRVNSNYLTPRTGALSVDLFTCLMIVARNMIVNWLVLISFFAFSLVTTMCLLKSGSSAIDNPDFPAWCFGLGAVVFMVINGLIAVGVMPIFPRAQKPGTTFGPMSTEYSLWMNCRWGLTLLASFFLAIWLRGVTPPPPADFFLTNPDYWPVYAVIVLPYLFGIVRALRKHQDVAAKDSWFVYSLKIACALVLSLLVSYALARGLIALLCPAPHLLTAFFRPVAPHFGHTLYLALAPAAWILLFEVENFVMIGCLSLLTNDEDREWWARSNGAMVLLVLGWTALCVIAAYGPALYLILMLNKARIWTAIASQITFGGILALLSSSAKTPATSEDRPAPVRTALLQAGAVLFFVVLLMLLAAANYRIAPDSLPGWFGLVLILGLITFAASLVVNINQFSIQCLYRNRLLRCYIGAVRRNPAYARNDPNPFEPFTGFDTTDNYDVTKLQHQLPFHVINMAQNLIDTTNLAWQERKASSFVVTPLHTGGEQTGYRKTSEFGQGISIGTAMATSGAAVNPSMGHCTAPILELLMALFNVRLGWWVGSPAHATAWKEVGPSFALRPLLKEMFGQTSEGQKYVLLSDGGHFEDLGIYEMIQRRCRFVLAVDGGAEPKGTFEDLGNAIRKVRIDLGVEIDFLFNRTTVELAPKPKDRQHFAVAKIRYSQADGTDEENDGWLLYIKCNLNGDEPMDIYQYKRFCDDFPNQTTLDQWFSESQFESYRKLGLHSLEKTFEAVKSYNPPHSYPSANVPGRITDAELGDRKTEFLAFRNFLLREGFFNWTSSSGSQT